MSSWRFRGPHRIGIFALDHPVWGALCLLLIIAASVLGISMIKSNFSIASMFAADNEQFSRYQRFKHDFPLNDRDVLVVVRTDQLNRDRLENVRLLHLDLELFDGVEGVLSAFSLPAPEDNPDIRLPHLPEDLPDDNDLRAMLERFSKNVVSDKFLGQTPDEEWWMVLAVTFAGDVIGPHTVLPTLGALDEFLNEHTAGTGLRFDMVGVPVLEGMFKTGGRSDRRVFNLAGLLIGLVVSTLFLRDLRYVAMVFFCPVLSVMATYGAMGLAGKDFSLLMGAAPPLIMVIAFANAMHLVNPVLRSMKSGEHRDTATRRVLEEVGPSCFLAMTTTGLALLSLVVSGSGAIRDFAIITSLGMAMIFLVCMLVIPLFVRLLLPGHISKFGKPLNSGENRQTWPIGLSEQIAQWLPGRQSRVLVFCLLLFAILWTSYIQLDVRHRLTDEVPDHARAVLLDVNAAVETTSPNPLFIAVKYPDGFEAGSGQVLGVLEEVHTALENAIDGLEVWSALSMRSGLREGKELAEILPELPPQITRRFLNETEHTHLVTLYVENLDSVSLMERVSLLRPALKTVAESNPEFEFLLTGLSLVSADHATTTIPKLHLSMWIAITIVFGFISLFFRSISIALFAVLPNVLPIVATGAILHLSGWGLGYASVIALTVAFGVAVDDTIHFLARYRHHLNIGQTPAIAVERSIRDIGPVVITTTVVLVFGLSITAFGQMPHTRIFGVLCCVTLVVALIADLLVLPSVILAWRDFRLWFSKHFAKFRFPTGV